MFWWLILNLFCVNVRFGVDKQSLDLGVVEEVNFLEFLEVLVIIRVLEDMGQFELQGLDCDVKDGVNVKKLIWLKLGQRVNIVGI